ncbi:hypothetical protein OAM67_01100 [bacterium]|nr:hypothetical protein [bacterium]
MDRYYRRELVTIISLICAQLRRCDIKHIGPTRTLAQKLNSQTDVVRHIRKQQGYVYTKPNMFVNKRQLIAASLDLVNILQTFDVTNAQLAYCYTKNKRQNPLVLTPDVIRTWRNGGKSLLKPMQYNVTCYHVIKDD